MTLETQAAFARRLGKNRSHVTRLKQAGRLVMRDGRIVVEDSLQRLEATESPLPRDNANRARLAEARTSEQVPDETLAAAGQRQKIAQADKMEHEAAIAKLERARLEGRLVASDEVAHGALELANTLRAGLESLPDRIAPELAAATDTAQVHAQLAEAIEVVLGALNQEISTLLHAWRGE